MLQADIVRQLLLTAICAVIIIEFYVIFGLTKGFVFSAGMFIAALATQAMLGFSPTIFASGQKNLMGDVFPFHRLCWDPFVKMEF